MDHSRNKYLYLDARSHSDTINKSDIQIQKPKVSFVRTFDKATFYLPSINQTSHKVIINEKVMQKATNLSCKSQKGSAQSRVVTGFTLPPRSRFLFGFKRPIHTDLRGDWKRSLHDTKVMTFKRFRHNFEQALQ